MEVMFEGINPKKLLHAYLIEGEEKRILSALLTFFQEQIGMAPKGNPDVYVRSHDTFTIEHARALHDHASKKALGGGKKLFSISFQSITREAQNALLKLFEEPTDDTHFFIVTPQADILLPTLRSRLFSIRSENEEVPVELARIFLATDGAHRLELLRDIISEKNKPSAIRFLNALEAVLYERADFKKNTDTERGALKEIQVLRGYLSDRSPSVKMILEHIVVTTPLLKSQ